MDKRKFLIGTYDTAEQLWTLADWSLSDPEQVRSWVDVPGRRKGPIDASTVLTDGEPAYSNRTLTIILESSEGTRLEREARIEQMLNQLDGWWVDLILPDDLTTRRYMRGTVSVKKIYNTPAQARVQVTAICEPWKYAASETVARFVAGSSTKTATLVNNGRMTVSPLLKITGSGASVQLKYAGHTWTLSEGSYALPDLILKTGSTTFTHSGTGSLMFTYREAVL